MKIMTPIQMQKIDKKAISEYGIPGILLMEHAAYHIFKYINEKFSNQKILILCGPGNNGGDGFALARQLSAWTSHKVKILMLANPEKLSEDGKVYYAICEKIGIEVIRIDTKNLEIAYKEIGDANIIVDALFGTGLSKKIEGTFAEVIAAVNLSTAYIISVDIPSGIDGITGKVQGIGVQADKTISFALGKIGLYMYPAVDYVGELDIVDIGIPYDVLKNVETSYYTIDKQEMKQLLPVRLTRSNKGTYGKVLVIGGQVGMSGAVVLTSKAALKVGAGITTAAVPEAIHDIMEQKLTEVMTVPLKDKDGHLDVKAAGEVQHLIDQYDVIAIGPGLGREESVKPVLLQVLASSKPCVIDADALYFLRECTELLRVRKAPTIITPHPGEMSRLVGLSIEKILEQPLLAAKRFSTENHVVTVLKIERTVVADTEGNIYINISGNSGMAKGGSGDILTGIIAGLLAQKLSDKDAARLGVYLHARSADIMKARKTEYTILPSDIYEGIDEAFREIINV